MSGSESLKIDPDDFWELYTQRRLVRLERTGAGYSGSALIGEELQPFTVPRAQLEGYDYQRSPYFAYAVRATVSSALLAVVESPWFEPESAINRWQLELASRMAGKEVDPESDYEQLRSKTMSTLQTATISLDSVADRLKALEATDESRSQLAKTGELRSVGVEKLLLIKALSVLSVSRFSQALEQVLELGLVTSAAVCRTDLQHLAPEGLLIDIVENPLEHGRVVDAALWALGRRNSKSQIERLLGWLDEPHLRRRRPRIHSALQFVLSGPTMIELPEGIDRGFWEGVVRTSPELSDDDAWATADVRSVFWEKRLRCAADWSAPNRYPELFEDLLQDEVKLVSREASRGLVGRPGRIEVVVGSEGDRVATSELQASLSRVGATVRLRDDRHLDVDYALGASVLLLRVLEGFVRAKRARLLVSDEWHRSTCRVDWQSYSVDQAKLFAIIAGSMANMMMMALGSWPVFPAGLATESKPSRYRP